MDYQVVGLNADLKAPLHLPYLHPLCKADGLESLLLCEGGNADEDSASLAAINEGFNTIDILTASHILRYRAPRWVLAQSRAHDSLFRHVTRLKVLFDGTVC